MMHSQRLTESHWWCLETTGPTATLRPAQGFTCAPDGGATEVPDASHVTEEELRQLLDPD